VEALLRELREAIGAGTLAQAAARSRAGGTPAY
jgi:hypothetical protein